MTIINGDVKELRRIMPTAIITAHLNEKSIDYEVEFPKSITLNEHELLIKPIKQIFQGRFIERYTKETGRHFHIYVRYANSQNKQTHELQTTRLL